MMTEMMEQCCDKDGKPGLEKIKAFMPRCGKTQFSEEELVTLRHFCGQEGQPDFQRIGQFMERCGCSLPRAGKS
jgi:hypothetical protein